MIKEVIRFRLRLGPQTDEFLARYREVRTAMKALGVEPGIAWTTIAGQRQLIVERAFDTLASYEADDAAFHGGEEFMATWRKLESTAASMEAEIWQTSATREEGNTVRARRTLRRQLRPGPVRTGWAHMNVGGAHMNETT